MEGNRCWVLPTFMVTNPQKPDKVRIVWDAAAQVNGISLNSVLMTGSDYLAPLPGILLRFRQGKIAVAGDKKEMFHQIGVKAEDQRRNGSCGANPEKSTLHSLE